MVSYKHGIYYQPLHYVALLLRLIFLSFEYRLSYSDDYDLAFWRSRREKDLNNIHQRDHYFIHIDFRCALFQI